MTVHPLLRNRLVLAALGGLALLLVVLAAWRLTPLAEWLTAERVVDWVETFKRYWWAPSAVALLYTPASIVLFPRALLTVAAAVAFGPWKGFAIAMAGVIINALLGYIAGRQLDPKIVKRAGGAKMDRVGKAIKKEGLLSVASVGLVPIAPFFIEMLAFGALRLKLWHVLAGVTLANLPGTIASTLLGDQVHALFSDERTLNPWMVAIIVAMVVMMAFTTHRLWKRMRAA